MRFQGLMALAALVLITFHTEFVRADQGIGIYPGLVLSAGGAYSSRDKNATDNPGAGSGFVLDADYTHIIPNAGVSYKSLGGGVSNVYAGIGASGVLQLQLGYGTRGFVKRLRSDLNFARLFEFLNGTRPSRYNTSVSDRFTFSAAVESYPGNPQYDNVAFGLGLLY